MIVAMITVWMVQMAVHKIVHVVTVRDRFVATGGAVHMAKGMPIAAMLGRATVRIHITDRQGMLLNRAIGPLMMEMTIVQKVLMIPVTNRRVATALSMTMFVIHMQIGHNSYLPCL